PSSATAAGRPRCGVPKRVPPAGAGGGQPPRVCSLVGGLRAGAVPPLAFEQRGEWKDRTER
ncbi:MAG: hypothetical protein ACK5F7_23185, partial [Planctomycetaceae bacterium]